MLRPSTPEPAVAYYTVANHRFFLGDGRAPKLTAGNPKTGRSRCSRCRLDPERTGAAQRSRNRFRSSEATRSSRVVMKTYAHLSRLSVVVIDSDMIVTGSLDHVLALASEGKSAY
jgi:hypothetical protein